MEGTAPLQILGATAYPLTVASARVRVAAFERFLRPHGIALSFRPTLTDGEYRTVVGQAPPGRKAIALARGAMRTTRPLPPHDLLLVHRLRLLTPLPGFDPPRRLDAYDLDDALFLGSTAPANRRYRWAKQEAQRCVACLRRTRLVIAGNAFLAAAASQHAARVAVIPSCVDPSAQRVRTHEQAEIVTVGWIGSQTTGEYLKPVLPVVAAMSSRLRLVVVGTDTGVRAPWIEHRPWVLERERDDLARFDIGIMPLPDSDWARGKCGYKLLQYFSAGVPAIASPVGVAPELIDADHGLLATTTEEWRAALERLIDDVDERRERGLAARRFVERDYSYSRWAPELASLLHELAS